MDTQIVSANNIQLVRTMYNKYAGMLLGYIYEVVKDKKLSEEYLIAVFNELPKHTANVCQPGTNIYLQLQLITRKMLQDFSENISQCANWEEQRSNFPLSSNKFLIKMNEEQQQVFCSVHYYGKKISEIAAKMNKPETEVRNILQQAITIIKKWQA